jgi:hypothetical protein
VRALTFLVTSYSLSASGAPAEEAYCTNSVKEFVQLSFAAPRVTGDCSSRDPEIEERIVRLIRADLLLRNIDVCLGLPQAYHPPLATVRIEGECSPSFRVSIELKDHVTDKELLRHVTLAGLPRDTYATAIAVEVVELLRASWAETRLTTPLTERGEIPGAVEQVLRDPRRNDSVRAFLGIGIVGEAFAGGLRQGGLDAELSLGFTPNVEVFGNFGGRAARSVGSEHGRVTSDSWLMGIGGRYRVFRLSSRVELGGVLRLEGARASFSASALKGAIATSYSGFSAWSSGGLMSSVKLADRAWFDSEISAGWVLRPVVATDAGRTVMGAQGGYVGLRFLMRVQF